MAGDRYEESTEHYGKAMVACDGTHVTITTECNTCGKIVIGPIPKEHLMSVIGFLQRMAEQIGVTTYLPKQEIVKDLNPRNMDEFREMQKEFNTMSMRMDDDSKPDTDGDGGW